MAKKITQQPKRVGGWLYRRLPWYGKLMVPIVVIAMGVYLVGWLFG